MTIISNILLAQSINELYDFPLKPGMPEWANLNSHDEMVDAVQIPQNIANRMTTRSLVETCLNYPLFRNITAYRSKKIGMEILIDKYFNGFAELLKRKDSYNANGLSSGIYFYKLNVNDNQLINKMLLMK